MKKIALTLIVAGFVFSIAPAVAGELDDLQLRAGAAASEPFAIPDAAAEDAEHAVAFASIMSSYASATLVSCAPTALAYSHVTQRDLQPVGILTGKDVIAAVGNCASPLVLQNYDVEVAVGAFKYNSTSRKYDIELWRGLSAAPTPAVAGQGANEAHKIHVYAYNAYPLGFVRGCAWFTKPVNTYAGRTCTAPNPVI